MLNHTKAPKNRLQAMARFATCDTVTARRHLPAMCLAMARRGVKAFAAASVCLTVWGAQAPALQAAELNIYSARHYKADEALYDGFTAATGIKVNRIEGKGDALLTRIQSEGANSPADILITVDVGRLYRADQADVFQPVSSPALEAAVPAHLRHPAGHWFGFSTRARLIFFDKTKVEPGAITRYEDLADPTWKGKVCIRESANVYNQSMLGSLIAALGEDGARDWATAVVANFARPPVKGDTNQLRGIMSGECQVAVANSYYYLRLLNDPEEADKGWADKLGFVFPNQADRGAHVNISGAGVLKHAPNREAAVKFLEYLLSPEAQTYFSAANNEYPVVAGIAVPVAAAAMGTFKADTENVALFGENQPLAQKIFDQVGWR